MSCQIRLVLSVCVCAARRAAEGSVHLKKLKARQQPVRGLFHNKPQLLDFNDVEWMKQLVRIGETFPVASVQLKQQNNLSTETTRVALFEPTAHEGS